MEQADQRKNEDSYDDPYKGNGTKGGEESELQSRFAAVVVATATKEPSEMHGGMETVRETVQIFIHVVSICHRKQLLKTKKWDCCCCTVI